MTSVTVKRTEADRLAALRRMHLNRDNADERYERVTRLVCQILDVPKAAISIVDEDIQWFKAAQGMGVKETPRSISFCDHTIRQKAVMEVADARQDDRFASNPLVTGDPNIVFYAGYPLLSPDGYTVGALCAIDTRTRALSDEQRQALKDLAGIVQDQFTLGALANRDVLTGLYNRRYFDECLENEWRRHMRQDTCLSLLFFDVDHFKEYNDAYGHGCGDRCLQRISDTAQDHARRAGDLLARYGGEEFVVLLACAHEVGARQKAEQLRRAIAGLQLKQSPSCGNDIVTVSVGGATAIPSEGMGPRDLMELADTALYRAKREGRDRVCWAGD